MTSSPLIAGYSVGVKEEESCSKNNMGKSRITGAYDWVTGVWPEISIKYVAKDVYNCDETGLYFKALPDGTICFKDDTLFGGKKAKERVTVLLNVNTDGSDKRKPLVIGKSAKPRCFKGVKSLPVTYKANKNAWTTAQTFEEWLKEFDRDMDKANRKVCLLLDNCSAHNVNTDSLKATELIFLPPNTTSVIQPLDQGIIIIIVIVNITIEGVFLVNC